MKSTNYIDSAAASLKPLSDLMGNLDLNAESERNSMDSDCSLYEIEPEGRQLPMLDLAIEEQPFDDASFYVCPPSPLFSSSTNRQRYRAWIGSRNLHIA
jgi:hypothetical protein